MTLLRRLARWRRWAWLPLLLAAAWLRVPGLAKPLWEDEAATLQGYNNFAGLRWIDWLMPAADLHRAGTVLVNTGSLSLARLPYLLVGLAGVFLAWRLGRVWRSWSLAFVLAAAVALWPYKLFWDTLAREYTLMMAMGLATIVLWERYRTRRRGAGTGWHKFAAALVVNALAALTHELAIVLLVFPLCYMLGESAVALRRRVWRDRRAAIAWLGGTLLVLLSVHLTLTLALGSGYWRLTAQGRGSSAVVGNTSAGFSSFRGTSGYIPGVEQALDFTRRNVALAFRPGKFSAAPLLGLESGIQNTSGSYIFNQLTLDPRGVSHIARGSRLDIALLSLLLLGLAGVLLRSPPLALALLAVISSTSMLIFFNQHLRVPVDRYYTLAALGCFLFVVYGAWWLAVLVARAVRCAVRRLPVPPA